MEDEFKEIGMLVGEFCYDVVSFPFIVVSAIWHLLID